MSDIKPQIQQAQNTKHDKYQDKTKLQSLGILIYKLKKIKEKAEKPKRNQSLKKKTLLGEQRIAFNFSESVLV